MVIVFACLGCVNITILHVSVRLKINCDILKHTFTTWLYVFSLSNFYCLQYNKMRMVLPSHTCPPYCCTIISIQPWRKVKYGVP